MTFMTPGIAFLLTVAFGVWLSSVSKPYNGLLFNVHKLIALGAVIVTTLEMYNALQRVGIRFDLIAFLSVAALGVIALFASGALLSLEKLNYTLMRAVHRIALGVVAVALGAALLVLFA